MGKKTHATKENWQPVTAVERGTNLSGKNPHPTMNTLNRVAVSKALGRCERRHGLHFQPQDAWKSSQCIPVNRGLLTPLGSEAAIRILRSRECSVWLLTSVSLVTPITALVSMQLAQIVEAVNFCSFQELFFYKGKHLALL